MGFSFEIQAWPIQFWPELSIRMITRDNAYNTTMTLSNDRNPAEQPTASGQLPARRAAPSLWVIETLLNGCPEIELKTAEFSRQLRRGQRWLQLLPVVNRCLGA